MTSTTKWQGVLEEGFAPVQVKSTPLYRASSRIHVFTPNLMAGLLQTPAYTTALLHTIAAFSGTPDDAEAGAARRAERSQVIQDESKDIRIILDQAVLHRRIGGPRVMVEQLSHVLNAAELPAVTLGVIPADTDWRSIWPLEAFYMFDEAQVQIELLTEFVEITEPDAIASYVKAFELLTALAVFGDEAQVLVSHALAAAGNA